MSNLIPVLIVTVAIATVLNIALKKINMPTVIGYIFTGAIVGSIFDIYPHAGNTIEHIAEFGIVFLMFTIGLEFSLAQLGKFKREVFVFGALQVVTTAIVFSAIAHLAFSFDLKSSIIVGSGLALSSTAIVLKMLNESGKTKVEYGRNSVGILIFQDIAVIPILLMITIFTSDASDLSGLLVSTAVNAVIALLILVLAGKYLLSHWFQMVSNTNSKEIYMGSVLLIAVGASYIAHYFGFSYSLGGFIAGMMIADTIYKYQVEADLIPFRDLLLGVFFVSVGFQIDVNLVATSALTVVGLTAAIVTLKALAIVAVLWFFCAKKTVIKTAITLAQVGEFSLVVFSLLLASKMTDPEPVQLLMAVVVLSMIATPFLINYVDKIVAFISKEVAIDDELDLSGDRVGHVILCGYGAFGRVVANKLSSANIEFVVVTNSTEAYVSAKESGEYVVFGEASDRNLLESLKIDNAMATVLALDDLHQVEKASAAIELIGKDIKVYATVANEEQKLALAPFNHDFIVSSNEQIADVLVDDIHRSQVLANEKSQLEFIDNYSIDSASETIDKIAQEQVRLLGMASRAFDALRSEGNYSDLAESRDSFDALKGVIDNVIDHIMRLAKLSPQQYERINLLLDNQHLLVAMNEVLNLLASEIKELEKSEQTNLLAMMAIEGMDTVLLTLIALAKQYDEDEMALLERMTSTEGEGLARLRSEYMGASKKLDAEGKMILVSATNHMDRLKILFGAIGANYKKMSSSLAE